MCLMTRAAGRNGIEQLHIFCIGAKTEPQFASIEPSEVSHESYRASVFISKPVSHIHTSAPKDFGQGSSAQRQFLTLPARQSFPKYWIPSIFWPSLTRLLFASSFLS